jgi:hypothetical protein
LKNGQTSGFAKFSEKSMIYREIMQATSGERKVAEDMHTALDKKRETILVIRTPKAVCETYIDLEVKQKTAVNKKKKEIEREMVSIREEYKTVLDDIKKVKELASMELEYEKQIHHINYMEEFIQQQTDHICKIMVEQDFIEIKPDAETTSYQLTRLGELAANIAEVHPLPITTIMTNYSYFADFTPRQLIGVFSCFTDVKIPSDQRSSIPHTTDGWLKRAIQELAEIYQQYESREIELDIRTGICYESVLMYDMIEYSMRWCDCNTEEECKYFIQAVISEKEISIGDFTKAMMKIVTIAKELMNICEKQGAIDLMYKLSQIEGMVLKYVLTAQSLYI